MHRKYSYSFLLLLNVESETLLRFNTNHIGLISKSKFHCWWSILIKHNLTMGTIDLIQIFKKFIHTRAKKKRTERISTDLNNPISNQIIQIIAIEPDDKLYHEHSLNISPPSIILAKVLHRSKVLYCSQYPMYSIIVYLPSNGIRSVCMRYIIYIIYIWWQPPVP